MLNSLPRMYLNMIKRRNLRNSIHHKIIQKMIPKQKKNTKKEIWQYCRDKPVLNNAGVIADFSDNDISDLFNQKKSKNKKNYSTKARRWHKKC